MPVINHNDYDFINIEELSFVMNCYKNALRVAILLSTTLATSNAISQIEEIIVSGVLQSNEVNSFRPPLQVIDLPQSVSIMTGDEIRSRGFRELADIVRYTPGLNTSQGEGHRDSIVFRGVRSTADFYRDGLRDDVQYYRSLYNVEQVEILRGANALLFGRGGTGGIINRVIKEAMIGEQIGSFDIGVDSFGAFDLAADYNVQTSDNSALRINIHSDSLKNHRDFYDGNRVGFNPTFKMQFSPETTLDVSYEHANHERFIDRGIPTENGKPVEALNTIVFGGEDINVQRLKADIFRGNLSHEFSASSKANLTVQYSDFEKMYQNLYVSNRALGDDGQLVTMDGYRDPTSRANLFINGNVVNEFETSSVKHTFSLGGEIVRTDNTNFRYNTFWSTTSDDNEVFNVTDPMNFSINSSGIATNVDFTSDLNNSTTSDIQVTSVYIHDQINATDNFIIMLGGRFDMFDITVADLKNRTSESREDSEFSPRAGLVYKPREDVSLYVSYSESFLPRAGEQFKKLTSNAARLDPDVFENTEIGFKWNISSTLSFAAAYFDSEQTQAVRDSVTGEGSEIVGLQVDGYELELKGEVNDSFYIAAGYSNLDGKTSTGGEPREIPEYTAHLWANYQVNNNFGIGLGITHQGESNIKNNNSDLILPDYTRWDAAAYYDVSDDLTIQLNIENLTNELYFPHSHSTHQVSVGEKFNARLSISRRF